MQRHWRHWRPAAPRPQFCLLRCSPRCAFHCSPIFPPARAAALGPLPVKPDPIRPPGERGAWARGQAAVEQPLGARAVGRARTRASHGLVVLHVFHQVGQPLLHAAPRHAAVRFCLQPRLHALRAPRAALHARAPLPRLLAAAGSAGAGRAEGARWSGGAAWGAARRRHMGVLGCAQPRSPARSARDTRALPHHPHLACRAACTSSSALSSAWISAYSG